jgi:hypothetical protein
MKGTSFFPPCIALLPYIQVGIQDGVNRSMITLQSLKKLAHLMIIIMLRNFRHQLSPSIHTMSIVCSGVWMASWQATMHSDALNKQLHTALFIAILDPIPFQRPFKLLWKFVIGLLSVLPVVIKLQSLFLLHLPAPSHTFMKNLRTF